MIWQTSVGEASSAYREDCHQLHMVQAEHQAAERAAEKVSGVAGWQGGGWAYDGQDGRHARGQVRLESHVWGYVVRWGCFKQMGMTARGLCLRVCCEPGVASSGMACKNSAVLIFRPCAVFAGRCQSRRRREPA